MRLRQIFVQPYNGLQLSQRGDAAPCNGQMRLLPGCWLSAPHRVLLAALWSLLLLGTLPFVFVLRVIVSARQAIRSRMRQYLSAVLCLWAFAELECPVVLAASVLLTPPSHVFMVSLSIRGHVVPLSRLAAELVARGHTVSFAAHEDARDLVTSADGSINFVSLGRHRSGHPFSRDERRAKLKEISLDRSFFRGILNLVTEVYVPYSTSMFLPVYRAVDRLNPDLMVVDIGAIAGIDVAHALQVPYVINNPSLLHTASSVITEAVRPSGDCPCGAAPGRTGGAFMLPAWARWLPGVRQESGRGGLATAASSPTVALDFSRINSLVHLPAWGSGFPRQMGLMHRCLSALYPRLLAVSLTPRLMEIGRQRVDRMIKFGQNITCQLCGPSTVITNTAFGLEIPQALPPSVRMTGPIMPRHKSGSGTISPPSLRRWLGTNSSVPATVDLPTGSGPVVLVLFGSGSMSFMDAAVVTALARALSDTSHYRVLWALRPALRQHVINAAAAMATSAGSAVEADAFHIRTNFAQLPVLAHSAVRLVVSPCGPGTAQEALFFGKPLLCIPTLHDQLDVAARVADAGAGMLVAKGDIAAMTTTALKHTIWQLCKNSSYRIAATRLGNILRAAGGVSSAADIVESAVAVAREDADSQTAVRHSLATQRCKHSTSRQASVEDSTGPADKGVPQGDTCAATPRRVQRPDGFVNVHDPSTMILWHKRHHWDILAASAALVVLGMLTVRSLCLCLAWVCATTGSSWGSPNVPVPPTQTHAVQ